MEIIKFDNFLNESFTIPNIKIDEFLHNIAHADKVYKAAAAAFYTTFESYVDIKDPANHVLVVNDMRGDIMNNNRVIIQVMIFKNSEIGTIKTNIVNFCLNEFYAQISSPIDIFGIQAKPITYIKKEEVKQLFESGITDETTLRIISETSGFNYEGIKNDFHFWSKK